MGIFFGLLSGFFDATKNVFAKKSTAGYSELTITFIWMLFAAIVTLPFALFSIPHSISIQLIFILISVTLLDFFAYIFYLRSLKYADLSLSLPMLSLTPVFVLFISYITLKQTISATALLGVGAIIIGSYSLNLQKSTQGIFTPFRNIFSNKGVRYMLFTSILWGFANSLHKIGITDSNPLFYTGISYVLLSTLYFIVLLYKNRKELIILTRLSDLKMLAPAGFLEGTTTIFQFLSQGFLTSSVLTIALKRSSIVFSALFGYLFFKENVKSRLIPICIIIAGVILVSL
jgi:drug/metabolite transporter (DMT)-like permease